MLRAVFHRLVVAVTLLAFIGGMTLQLMPSQTALAAGVTPSASDCAKMNMLPEHAGAGHKAPCKGSGLPECIKHMGCLGTPSLPLLRADIAPFAYNKIVYWTPAINRDGRSIEPDLFPPIGL